MKAKRTTPVPGRTALVDGHYRYQIEQVMQRSLLSSGGRVTFLMLNPSDADVANDDPTWRRCLDFGSRLGFSDVCAVNLYGWMSSDPAVMSALDYETAVGPRNDDRIVELCARSRVVIAAWGAHHSAYRSRQGASIRHVPSRGIVPRCIEVLRLLEASIPNINLQCLGYTPEGAPRHPLFMPKDAELKPFVWRTTLRVQQLDAPERWWRMPGDYTMQASVAVELLAAHATFSGPTGASLFVETEDGVAWKLAQTEAGLELSKVPLATARKASAARTAPLHVAVPNDWETSPSARVPEVISAELPNATLFRGKMRCGCDNAVLPKLVELVGGDAEKPRRGHKVTILSNRELGVSYLGQEPNRSNLRLVCPLCSTTYQIHPDTKISWLNPGATKDPS